VQAAAIYEQLTELFRDLFANDDIVLGPETTAKDVEGWDSFNHISVLVAVETRFGIKMSTREIDKIANIGDLVQLIESKLCPAS
jgi:acyl carrier protein